MRGKFIVLEGIDGSGTTTQAKILTKRLEQRGVPVFQTAEPSDLPIGKLIRQYLHGRSVDPYVMTSLFMADRREHTAAKIAPALEQGLTVVCDRYVHSTFVYQGQHLGFSKIAHICNVLGGVLVPDLTILLDVAPDLAFSRVASRGNDREVYERLEFQVKIADFYRKNLLGIADAIGATPQHKSVVIDGGAAIEMVAGEIDTVVSRSLGI